MRSKKVTGFTGIVAFPNLTFRSDDDDFNVSDVIMSRMCSADDRGLALERSKLFSIKRYMSSMHKLDTNTDMNKCKTPSDLKTTRGRKPLSVPL